MAEQLLECEAARSVECTPNKSLRRTFDPLLIFAAAKTGIASNAGELRRLASVSLKSNLEDESSVISEGESRMTDSILTSIISNGIVLAVLGFLLKSLIVHFLDKDINSYKYQLEATNLRMNISFGGIYLKHAEALASLYRHMLQLELYAELIKKPEDWNDYRDRIRTAANHYHEVRIYIPASIDARVLEVLTKAHNLLTQSLNDHTPAEFIKKFSEAKEAALAEMRRLMSVEERAS